MLMGIAGMIRIAYAIRDADGSAWNDKTCLCYEMLQNVKKCYKMLRIVTVVHLYYC
jgi:hypothetical protein